MRRASSGWVCIDRGILLIIARLPSQDNRGRIGVKGSLEKMKMDAKQVYAGNNHVLTPTFHMSVGNPTFRLEIGSRRWFTEWHYYFGPMVVHGRTGDPLDKIPGERSAFWIIAQWWHDQGCQVVDGVGVWQYPEVEVVRCAKTGRAFRFWKGYQRLGPVRKL